MDRYEAMRVFIRIVERQSFTRAAEDLSLPRSTVTEAVKQLETRLRVRLLQRTTRHVSPTLDGEAYYKRCLILLADLADPSHPVTISESLANDWSPTSMLTSAYNESGSIIKLNAPGTYNVGSGDSYPPDGTEARRLQVSARFVF